jgi:DNA-binding protein YbaB
MKGLGQLMKQAQAMQENMQRLQNELASLEVEGQAGGGWCASCYLQHQVRRVTIEPSFVGGQGSVR